MTRALVGLAAASLLLLAAFAPGLRTFLARFEQPLPFVLFLAALGVCLAQRAFGRGARGRAFRRCEARRSRELGLAVPPLAMLAFLFPVWSQEAGAATSRVPATAMLLGRVPWLDAHGHFEGANRLLADGRLNGFTERRPLNTPWLALRLRLGGLDGALWVQALLMGLAAALLARALAAAAGTAAGLACFALVYGYARDYAAVVVSEPLGVSFACLALALLLSCARTRSLSAFVAGLLMLELALRTRPGAQMLLPCVVVWGCAWLRRPRSVLLTALLVLATGEATTRALLHLYGSGQASFVSYPAFTLYGLAHNANYVKAKQDFATELAVRPETEVARRMYAAALQRVIERPSDLAHALGSNLGRFLEKLPANTARTLSARSLVARGPDWIRPQPRQARLDAWLAAPLLTCTLALALVALPRRKAPERGMWLALLFGTVASAPFVYGDAGFRGLLVGQPVLACLLALGLATRARPRGSRCGVAGTRAGLAFAGAMVGLALAAPPLVRLAPLRSRPATTPAPDAALLDLRLASTVRVGSREAGEAEVLSPQEYLLRLGHARLGAPELWRRRPPFALVSAYDRLSGRQRIVFAPPEFLGPDEPLRRVRLRTAAAATSAEQVSTPVSVVSEWEAVAE